MARLFSKLSVLALFLLCIGFFCVQKANAASLGSVSDLISTSRPSAATWLSADQLGNASSIKVADIQAATSTLFLASDSATILGDGVVPTSVGSVASMSAQITGSPNYRNIYFTQSIPTAHHQGEVVITPVTATHTIKLTTTTSVPIGGHIQIIFPGATNTASPSATAFGWNNLQPTTNITASFAPSGPTCDFTATTVGTIDCTVGSVETNHTTPTTVTITVGSSTPALVNPTKTVASGSSDNWKLNLRTVSSDGTSILDSSKTVISTIESVQVQATVEPYISFTIAGVNQGTANVCGASTDTTNPGVGNNSTATFVNLGVLTTAVNISAQTMTINTNGFSGYVLTATSSGHFINPATGIFLPDANLGNGLDSNDSVNGTHPVPGAITPAQTAFGIHPCAVGTTSIPTIPSGWGSGSTASLNAKYANPWNPTGSNFYATLANYPGPATNSTTVVEYAATTKADVLAGAYSTVLTYVATPSF